MSRTVFLDAICCMLAFFSLVASVGAEDCGAVLTPDVVVDLTKKDTSAYLDAAMCKKTYEEFKKSYGIDTSAKYFAISGKGNYTSDNYEKHKRSNCNALTKKDLDQSLYYRSEKIIPEKSRKEFVDCVTRRPLVCMFSPGMDVPNLEIHYHTDTQGKTKITSIQPENMTVPSTVIRVGGELKRGVNFVQTPIVDVSKPARFTMQTELHGKAEPCTAYLPAAAPPPKNIISFRITGTVWHSSSAFRLDRTVFEPKFKLSWPGIVGIYDWDLDIEQRVNDKLCASGKVTGTSQNFNQKTASSTTRFSPEFSGGAQTAKDGRVIEFFLNPKNNCN